MSWPAWHSTAPPTIQSTVIPTAVNPAPALLPPPATAGIPTGMQYSPEQWAQMQQQNWQQWAQWQQQYQQWHQQYGAEYQKSMNALSTSTPATAVPPPPPNESKPPPPPPPDEGLKSGQYNTIPPRPATGYSTIPPPTQQFSAPPPNQYPDQAQSEWQNSNSKRPLPQSEEYEGNKRQMVDNQNQWNKPNQAPKGGNSWQTLPPPTAQSQAQKALNLEELTIAEKKFDKEFAAWEAQFNKWKDQNANHPDKTQYLEYEKKWESWRNSLLDRREQMRKKRIVLQASMAATAPKPPTVPIQQSFNQPPPTTPAYLNPKDPPPADIFSKPPPTQNNEPLTFKPSSSYSDGNLQSEIIPDVGSGFLKSSSPAPGGIPGLDLVKESAVQGKSDDQPAESDDVSTPTNSKGPDLDAISKGINSILGDPKLLNMLSMVSQNQNISTGVPIDTQPKVPDVPPPPQKTSAPIPSLLTMPIMRPNLEKNDQNYDEYSESYTSGPLESVHNFDDQTRMSFSNGPNEQDLSYVSNPPPTRPLKTNNFQRFASTDNSHMFGGNSNNDYTFSRNNSFESSNNTRSVLNQPDNFRNERMNGPGFNQGNNDVRHRNPRGNVNFGNTYNQRYNEQYDNHTRYSEDGPEEQWNEEDDEYDKYHNMFNETDHSPEEPPENIPPISTQDEAPVDDEPLFVPEVVVDYEHKSIKIPEVEISLDFIRMFDYRHRQVNRIPYPQRPAWLSSSLRNIQQFDPLGTGRFSSNDRAPHFERDQGMQPRYPLERNERELKPNDDQNKYSRDRYVEPRNEYKSHMNREFDRDREKGRYDFSPKRARDMDYRQGNTGMSRNRYGEEKVGSAQLDLEELSDDEWTEEKTYSKKDGLKFSPPRRTLDDISPELSLAANPANPVASTPLNQNTTLDDLINPPGRYNRPPRIVIILRGPPGSGKTYLAKVIKDKEVENGGSAPRILSLDDYFMVEHEKEIIEDGRVVRIKEMTYEYEAEMEETYRQSLTRAFKKTITDGYFHFVVVDNVNQKVKNFGEMWSYAKQNGFQVYICQLDLDPELCTRRNIHHRSESYIEDCIAAWEPTPSHHPMVDATNFLQSLGSIMEVEMEEAEQLSDQKDDIGEEHVRSKWDTFDCSLNNLARLDGVSKPLRPSRTMEEYLQLDNEWKEPYKSTKPGQKRVRWADLEEQKQQKKMKAIGFVVGQTDWKRIMDPTYGESALTQTKFIERRFK